MHKLTLCSASSLNISKNLPKIKAKEVGHVMEAIVNLIQVTRSPYSIEQIGSPIHDVSHVCFG